MMPRPGKTGVTGMVPFGIPGMDANDNKPKGKMTAYAFFVQICRDEHKRKHPDEQVSHHINGDKIWTKFLIYYIFKIKFQRDIITFYN